MKKSLLAQSVALACLAGLSLPILWALVFGGQLPAPA